MDGGHSEPGSNHLLLGPLPHDEETAADIERVCTSDRPVPTVIVSTRQSPSAILECWQTHLGSIASRIDIISVSETAHSAPIRPDTTARHAGQITAVETSDLTGLGIGINEALSRRGRDAPVGLGFDSVTSLIHAVDFERVFRFLHVLTARVAHTGAIAFYHVDPTAHDPQTVTSLTYLFDTVIDVN